jgi:DNA polymerase-1
VRAFFISGKGYKFIDDDYASLEPRVFSALTGDEGLKEIYRNDWDFYSTVAIKTERLDEDKIKYPNGVSPDTKSPIFLKKLDPVKRNQAKGYSLGLAYGMSAYALSMTLGVSKEEGKSLYEGYLNGFPKLRKWIQTSREKFKKDGMIQNQVGRIRHLDKGKAVYDVFGESIMDWKVRKDLERDYGKDQVLQWYRDYKNALNNVLNFQIQSMAASVVNRAAIAINRKAKELGIDAKVVAQIHDQLVIHIKEDQAEEFAPIVQELMENTTKLDGVDLIAEPEIADNLADGH